MFEIEINQFINNYVRSNYSKINVKAGKCRYNYMCHANAVHEAFNKKNKEIALVVYFDGLQPCIHFINVNKKGNYIDNTLGRWSLIYEYYLIRHIPESEFWDVYKIHNSFRLHVKCLLPFYLRIFHNHKNI